MMSSWLCLTLFIPLWPGAVLQGADCRPGGWRWGTCGGWWWWQRRASRAGGSVFGQRWRSTVGRGVGAGRSCGSGWMRRKRRCCRRRRRCSPERDSSNGSSSRNERKSSRPGLASPRAQEQALCHQHGLPSRKRASSAWHDQDSSHVQTGRGRGCKRIAW